MFCNAIFFKKLFDGDPCPGELMKKGKQLGLRRWDDTEHTANILVCVAISLVHNVLR